jgi:nucleoside-diphosphate kinase
MLAKFFSKIPEEDKNLTKPAQEQTLVIIKGDAFARGIAGQIISELEKNFGIVAMKTITLNEKQVDQLYGGAKNLDFYPALKQYMMTGFHLAMVLEGQGALQRMLTMKGKIARQDSHDSLRSKFAIDDLISTIHCSHHAKDASREINLFFKKEEICKRNPEIVDFIAISQARHSKSSNIVP